MKFINVLTTRRLVLLISEILPSVVLPELEKSVTHEEPISRLPYAVVRMTDHLMNNPDKYFKGVSLLL